MALLNRSKTITKHQRAWVVDTWCPRMARSHTKDHQVGPQVVWSLPKQAASIGQKGYSLQGCPLSLALILLRLYSFQVILIGSGDSTAMVALKGKLMLFVKISE